VLLRPLAILSNQGRQDLFELAVRNGEPRPEAVESPVEIVASRQGLVELPHEAPEVHLIAGGRDDVRELESGKAIGLPVQINSTVTRHNLEQLDAMIALLEQLDIVLWSVFFLVPVGRGSSVELISAEEFERVFEKLYQTSRRVKFDIKSTEAQHYRRFLLQRRAEAKRKGDGQPARAVIGIITPDGIGRGPLGINDGKGFVFVSHTGEVFPSGFLPVSAGNVRKRRLGYLYRHSPLFLSLRDTKNLKGKCGICEFREICGGSRARAYATTGDMFAQEPCCVWQPRQLVGTIESFV
jgi:radical SAM protein with 4Fe4S-binding SPASM domain